MPLAIGYMLFRFLVLGVLLTPRTVLLEQQTFLYCFFVLLRVVVNAMALTAL